MAANGQTVDSLKECEEYVDKHKIKQLIKDCVVQLCLKRPENPVLFIRDHFDSLGQVRCLSFALLD